MKSRFRVGDKVRLIDEAAACEVSRIVSDKMVEIRDENGFEYKVNISDLVPLFENKNHSLQEKRDVPQEPVIQEKSESFIQFFSNTESLFLCALPENFDSLLHTVFKIYLVNSSNEIVLYSLNQANAADEASAYGVLNPEEEIFAGTFTPGKKPPGVLLQMKCIIHSDESKIMERQFSISPEDFTNEKLFHSKELFRRHVLSYNCFANEEIKIPDNDITKLVDHFALPPKKAVSKEKLSKGKKLHEPVLLTNEKTVDLHIEELTDDYNHMSNAEIISLQLNHFRKELDAAILNHYYRIIFIHGKGNGVLKSHIRSELDTLKLKYRDADTGRFGFGATEVVL